MSSGSDSTAEPFAKLLAIGDVHLGTRPSSLPDGLNEAGLDERDLTSAAALALSVELAINENVMAVVFAGDVVESTNARFEAIGPLEDAVVRLTQAGIPVYGVAGNHDVDALPRVAQRIEGFTLVGEGGRWESILIESEGQPRAELVGWSFPEAKVRVSPVAELLRSKLTANDHGVARLGLLHADLDASGGTYAPVKRQELADAGLDAWLLGHIHKPSFAAGNIAGLSGPAGYLGSLSGLDPSEVGARGPWVIDIWQDGQITARHVPLAPIRWSLIDLNVQPTDEPEDIGDQLLDVAEAHALDLQTDDSQPRAVGVRIRLIGATRHYQAIESWLQRRSWAEAVRSVGEMVVFINKVINNLALELDLDALARGDDPPALLARKLLVLKAGGEEAKVILDAARNELRVLKEEMRWSPLTNSRYFEDPLENARLTAYLVDSGTAALDRLLAQRPTPENEPLESNG